MSPESLPVAAGWTAAWIVTFAVHSTVLLGLAWSINSLCRALSDPFREVLWKLALLGAVLTTSCQLTLVSEPVAGHLAQVGSSASAITETEAPAQSRTREAGQGESAVSTALPVVAKPDSLATNPIAQFGTSSIPWEVWVLLLACLTSCLALTQGLIRSRSTKRLLRQRQPIRDGSAPAMLGRLTAKAGYWRAIRLSSHPELQTAIAFGVIRPEICLPERAFDELDEGEQQSMLAHELGHLIRRDPLWLRISGLMVILFPWQPLLRKGRRELQLIAEYRSDAIAADLSGNLTTARCLVEVAGWMAAGQQDLPIGVTGMAVRGSAFRERVERLLRGDHSGTIGRHRAWWLPLSTAVLAAATTMLPGAEIKEPRPAAAAPLEAEDSDESAVILLGRLIEQMEMEFSALKEEVELLRAELQSESSDEELAAMLLQLDAKLASLERHRELFLGVMDEWLEPRVAEPRSEPRERTEPTLRGDRK
ncbi:MAG: M56 family metallopeptidase [Planctomycetota bacterium]